MTSLAGLRGVRVIVQTSESSKMFLDIQKSVAHLNMQLSLHLDENRGKVAARARAGSDGEDLNVFEKIEGNKDNPKLTGVYVASQAFYT
ncbi:MAG: hypothetical protein KGS72_04155 [Cyanobacteria bacterium REEB67]|nr:hypothetical protein [Cyanobacteria bacterium REEB67]